MVTVLSIAIPAILLVVLIKIVAPRKEVAVPENIPAQMVDNLCHQLMQATKFKHQSNRVFASKCMAMTTVGTRQWPAPFRERFHQELKKTSAPEELHPLLEASADFESIEAVMLKWIDKHAKFPGEPDPALRP